MTYEYTAVVIFVKDGDSLRVNVDLGFDIWRKEDLRVFGIDAPETWTPEGKAAAAFVSALLPQGAAVRVSTTKYRGLDKFGRYLATVTLPDGRNLSDLLLAEGHAKPYFGGAR